MGYRWCELAFFNLYGNQQNVPFALHPDRPDFWAALRPGMHSFMLAYPAVPIDAEDKEAFIERWLVLTVEAAEGKLQSPQMLPINNINSFLLA